ncbi:hypothetical protein N665_1058s0011 [Sinapis alba]|nr:hypothetical protein N665_1058s0011 [Sinapis alba]
MRKLFAVILFSCFLPLLTCIDASTVACEGSLFAVNSTYSKNLNSLFSSLASNVIANDGFYNTSTGEGTNKVYGLALCGRGYEKQACVNCVEKGIQDLQQICPNRTKSFKWTTIGSDNASCLVRYANHSVFKKLELSPPGLLKNRIDIEETKSLKLFRREWEALVNLTVLSATSAPENSSVVLKFYSVIRAEFTEFADVYMMMQCTPDILSSECNQCLRQCVLNFLTIYWGSQGGRCQLPSCFFRWDLYSFPGSSENMTRVSMISPASTTPQGDTGYEKKGKRIRNGTIVIIVVPTVINLFVFVGLIVIFDQRRKSYNKNINGECSDSDGQSKLRFGLAMILSATDDFSPENMLGQGASGTVYKGILPNGEEIAVKRLVSGSGQGGTEFKNEVSLLARLQHKNLVKLIGFCNEGGEEILVYEFVLNSSLDHFIFVEERRLLLTWEVRFKIIEGIARALLYLHEDSQLKIIHRDLKASNILLGAEMNPKIADFGTARLFDTDDTRAETRGIARTRQIIFFGLLQNGWGKRIQNRTIVIIVVPTVISLFVFVGLIIIFGQRRKFYIKECSDSDEQSMFRFGMRTILSATDDFSPENKLGQGGFGTVYKGILLNGQEIAVKRLVSGSGQGSTEFKNEVSLLTRLEHKNLVKLLGFCDEGNENILVYELVPNSSLDHFIFDEEKRWLLTWEVRFKIIEGIARGLLYLHEDSQLKIIHRDLKASNILLDADMNPKIADFGTARMFDTNETRAETKRIAGTRGYMAPEYLNHGKISVKSDVFSFGVMLLEMISGERNNSFAGEGLAAFAWKRWVEGKPEIVIDPLLMKTPRNEIIKWIQIGLLCAQENAAKRPTMSSVILWLGSETVTIPLPRAPAFTRNQSQSDNSEMSMSNNIFTDLSCR